MLFRSQCGVDLVPTTTWIFYSVDHKLEYSFHSRCQTIEQGSKSRVVFALMNYALVGIKLGAAADLPTLSDLRNECFVLSQNQKKMLPSHNVMRYQGRHIRAALEKYASNCNSSQNQRLIVVETPQINIRATSASWCPSFEGR